MADENAPLRTTLAFSGQEAFGTTIGGPLALPWALPVQARRSNPVGAALDGIGLRRLIRCIASRTSLSRPYRIRNRPRSDQAGPGREISGDCCVLLEEDHGTRNAMSQARSCDSNDAEAFWGTGPVLGEPRVVARGGSASHRQFVIPDLPRPGQSARPTRPAAYGPAGIRPFSRRVVTNVAKTRLPLFTVDNFSQRELATTISPALARAQDFSNPARRGAEAQDA